MEKKIPKNFLKAVELMTKFIDNADKKAESDQGDKNGHNKKTE